MHLATLPSATSFGLSTTVLLLITIFYSIYRNPYSKPNILMKLQITVLLQCILCWHNNEVVNGFSIRSSPSSTPSSSQFRNGGRRQATNGDSEDSYSNSNDGESHRDEEILKSLTERYADAFPTVPTLESIINNSKKKQPPSKSDLYDDAELSNLLQLHKDLLPPPTEQRPTPEGPADDSFPSLHELILQTVEQVDKEQSQNEEEEDSSASASSDNDSQKEYTWLTDELRERSTKITAIASDVDGTLIGPTDQTLHPRTQAAVKRAVQAAASVDNTSNTLQWFFPATGKTRAGCLNSLGPELAAVVAQCPGVFIQGLYCVYGDEVIFEKKLTNEAVQACERLVAKSSGSTTSLSSLIAYDGDNLYTTDLTETVLDLHRIYGEPLPQEIPSLADHGNGIHKILVCDYDLERLSNVVRPQLEALAKETGARVTQAIPSMLELIPEGCSKALGVEKLCEVLGVDPSTQLLALGDAENDVEMLQMAAIGVAVGNACPLAKNAADVVLDESSDQGGAGLAMELLGGI
jgi:HAD superfamily hydrolase (TIGR01484 family)